MSEPQIMAIYDYHGKRSEVIQEGTEFIVNFYMSNVWKHATTFRSHSEAVRVAEQYAATGAPTLLKE